jgi:hypothetical protein
MADEYDETYDDTDPGVDGGDTISPLQMLMMPGYTTVTPEGKAQASKIFGDLYGKRGAYVDEEQAAYDEYETRAREAREVLKRAREVLAAKKTPTTKWLEMAKGFGSSTRAGSFGESVANYAGERIPGRQRETEWESGRDQQLLGFDTGMSTIDQQLAMQRLKLKQAGRTADDKLMIEAMKIMGKPTPMGPRPPRTPQDRASEKLDAAYVKDYTEFVQTGASNAASDIEALRAANRQLKGTKIDPKSGQEVTDPHASDTISGPVIGLLPKIVRDIITPRGSETQENVESVAQKSMRTIMGPQFTEGEGLRLLARVYNPRFEEKVNARRVTRLLSQLERAYAEKVRAAHYFEQHGTFTGFKGRTVWTGSMFDPDIPEGQSPLDAMRQEASALIHPDAAPAGGGAGAPPAGPAPDQGQEEIDIESLIPAEDDGQGFAEGGVVEGNFPDGRPRYRMPDGKIIKARPGDTYEFALKLYTDATGTAPTRPGLPPQQIPPRTDVPAEQDDDDVVDPVAQAPVQAAPPTEMDEAIGDIPSDLGHVAGGAAAAAAANKVLPAMGDVLLRRGENPAQRRVLDMMQEQRMDPATLAGNTRGLQRQGIPAMAMDDPTMRLTAESALSESGMPNATEALRRLKDRQENIGDRTMERVNKGLVPDEYFDQLDKLTDALYTNSKPLYEAAYAANPAVKSKVLPQLLETPDGKKAVKNALRLMRNSGKKIGKADVTGMVTSPSLEFLDYVKRGFDQLISKEESQGSTPLGKSMRDLRNALRDELDVATTSAKGGSLYKKARDQYAGDLEVLDALKAGREDFAQMQAPEVTRLVKDMSFAEKDAFRTGVSQRLFETIEAPAGEVNSAKRVIGSAANRKKLRALFDNDKQYELFETALQKESELYDRSKKSITRGEQGQELHAEPPDSPIKRAAKHVPRLGWKSPTMWILQFIRNNSVATEKKTDEVLRYLKASTPEELTDLEKTLGPKLKRRLSRKTRAGKVAAAGAVIGGGIKAMDILNEDDDDAE